MLNEPKTRVYLKKFKDLDRIVSVSVFVEIDSGMRENEQDNVLKLARNAVVLISRSWAGLIYLVSGELPHLIAALT